MRDGCTIAGDRHHHRANINGTLFHVHHLPQRDKHMAAQKLAQDKLLRIAISI